MDIHSVCAPDSSCLLKGDFHCACWG